MKFSAATLVFLIATVLSIGNAVAVPPGMNVPFAGGVIFDGKIHADKGLACDSCHPAIFQMKKGSTNITMAGMNAGKYCGVCHNGSIAFNSGDAANCSKCHKL